MTRQGVPARQPVLKLIDEEAQCYAITFPVGRVTGRTPRSAPQCHGTVSCQYDQQLSSQSPRQEVCSLACHNLDLDLVRGSPSSLA
jgi:hypothetical protein